jgi:hypothetical protein
MLGLAPGLLLAVFLAVAPISWTRAQEGTPTVPDVTFEPVAEGTAPPLVASQAGVRLERATFAPGARHTVAADDAELLLVAVESGALTVRSSAPLVVNRASAQTTAGAQAQELTAADTESTLGPGDSFVRPLDSKQELRNESEEPAAALMVSLAQRSASQASSATSTPEAVRQGAGVVVAVAVVVVPECREGYSPAEIHPMATPGGGGGGGGGGGVALAIAAAPECVGPGAVAEATPAP